MENASGEGPTDLSEGPAEDRFAAEGVRAAALVFVDNAGIARMKCVPLDRLQRAAERGVGLSVVFGGARGDDLFAAVPGISGPAGDIRLVADLEAAALLACAPGWLWAPVDQRDQEGRPWPGCQRTFLRRDAGGRRRDGSPVRGRLRAGVDGRARGRRAASVEFLHDGPGYGAATFGRTGDYLLALVDNLQVRRRGGRAGAPRVLGGADRDLPPSRRPGARLRRVRAGAAHSPHGGGAVRLARELLAGRHRRVGRQRRPRALQRLARGREPVLRRAGAGGAEAHRGGVPGGGAGAHGGADGVGGADRHLLPAAQAVALGERVHVLGAREPRGGAAPRERRRALGERARPTWSGSPWTRRPTRTSSWEA